LPNTLCRAEEPGRFAVTAGIAGQSGDAFEDVRDERVRLDFGAAREGVVELTPAWVSVTAGEDINSLLSQRGWLDKLLRCR
jgi:hypothetical protein